MWPATWLGGTDDLLDSLAAGVEWGHGRRWMYDRMVDDPAPLPPLPRRDCVPHPALAAVRAALEARYGVDLGPLALNYYRDGRDSVAFHRDRELRDVDDALIAIVTLGDAPAVPAPAVAGADRRARDLRPGPGDVLVMGGACQMVWEHARAQGRTRRAAHLRHLALGALE